MKLVVLVNGNSASASEIVSGAIQDLDAGVIMGSSKTYGKGLVQKIIPLGSKEGIDGALKYTVAKYYTPSGRCIQAIKYNGGRGNNELNTNTDSNNELNTNPESNRGLNKNNAIPVDEKSRKIFYTAAGRPVKDGGGYSLVHSLMLSH